MCNNLPFLKSSLKHYFYNPSISNTKRTTSTLDIQNICNYLITCVLSSGCWIGAGVRKSVGALGSVTGAGIKKFICGPLLDTEPNASGAGNVEALLEFLEPNTST